jgi:hypothetical protein
MRCSDVSIQVRPTITPDQLFAFYEKNNICEKGYGTELAAKPLSGSDLVVGAFCGDQLVGIVRAMFDGLSAAIVDVCLDLELQGVEEPVYSNGSLIEGDALGVGRRLVDAALQELLAMGADFISIQALEGVEEDFCRSLGFKLNAGHLDYIIDRRPYVPHD